MTPHLLVILTAALLCGLAAAVAWWRAHREAAAQHRRLERWARSNSIAFSSERSPSLTTTPFSRGA